MEITYFHKCIFTGAKRKCTVASIAPMVQSVRIFFFSHLLLYHFSLELIELSYTSSTPMELHVVHFKTQYLNLESALRQVDGVIIIVYFLKVII